MIPFLEECFSSFYWLCDKTETPTHVCHSLSGLGTNLLGEKGMTDTHTESWDVVICVLRRWRCTKSCLETQCAYSMRQEWGRIAHLSGRSRSSSVSGCSHPGEGNWCWDFVHTLSTFELWPQEVWLRRKPGYSHGHAQCDNTVTQDFTSHLSFLYFWLSSFLSFSFWPLFLFSQLTWFELDSCIWYFSCLKSNQVPILIHVEGTYGLSTHLSRGLCQLFLIPKK